MKIKYKIRKMKEQIYPYAGPQILNVVNQAYGIMIKIKEMEGSKNENLQKRYAEELKERLKEYRKNPNEIRRCISLFNFREAKKRCLEILTTEGLKRSII